MNPSEDPNDRLIDSLLSEQAKGKPDEALLRAVASKMQSAPKAKSPRRNLDFFWPATAAAVVLLAAGGLLWKAFEKPGDETRRLVEAPGPDPEKAGDPLPVATPGEEEMGGHEEQTTAVGEPEMTGTGDAKPLVEQVSREKEQQQLLALSALRYVRDESTMWYVQFGMESGGKWLPKMVARAADGKMQGNKMSALNMLSAGDTFFDNGFMAGRFKFLGFTERQVTSERTKLVQNVKFAEYEDLKSNKKGERYESQYGLPDAQLTDKAYYDRTAILEFMGKEFDVEERRKFRLPPDPAGQEFSLKQVTPERIVVEFPGADGKVVVREIARK
jgi:hypothetical protein